jgi:DegV family protein with EDD domain
MIKIFTDSGSSIKPNESEALGVTVIPLMILMNGKEYRDGEELSTEDFYSMLIDKKLFPKTSLPSLAECEEKVRAYTDKGDHVIFLTISSGLSGTYSAIKGLFDGDPLVHVVDTKSAVGGIRILVEEINKHINEPIEEVLDMIDGLIPRLKVVAVPETLEYLHRGGRLSKSEWRLGEVLGIKPLLGFEDGRVKVYGKVRGVKKAAKALADMLVEWGCDPTYSIIPSYTYNKKNMELLLECTDKKYLPAMGDPDDLDHAIACHWGPGAFGYIFVGKNQPAL